MRIDRLVVASKNSDKIAEIEEVLHDSGLEVEIIRGLSWPDVGETGSTLEENALKKAREVFEATGVAALADDTGLFVDALGGQPGVNTARFAGSDATYEENVMLLLERMEGVENRAGSFRTIVALVSELGELIAEGVLEGCIARNPAGTGGFGYDPVFEIDGGRTLAQLDADEKNRLSHRAEALRNLIRELE